MRRRLFLATLLTGGVLSSTTGTTNTVAQQNSNEQPQQHVIASPNPTIDDSKTPNTVAPVKVPGTKVRPAAAKTAAPLKKKTTRHKHRRKSRQ